MRNNAANNIEATSKTLRDLLKGRRYNVGYFQREYKWEKVHIEELFDDLERSFFESFDVNHKQEDVAEYSSYYMGPIVLFRDGSSFSIVDGQQRLTSFSLLFIYLKHLQKEVFRNVSNRIENLDEYVYSKLYGNETYNLDISGRKKILEKLFQGHKVNESDIDSESSVNVYHRYKDIEELFPIRLKKIETLPFFINWLTEKLVFIEIVAQTDESAYTIFETMNDRGLNLTPSEMLKSYLLALVKDEEKIKNLDAEWKRKINLLKTYSNEEDQDFFKAWLRGKYAQTIRDRETGSKNEDFERIGTRFHNWVQKNNSKIGLEKPNDFFFFVSSDFDFFSDVYLELCELRSKDVPPEHDLKIISYKGIASSLSFPFILAPIQKLDDNTLVQEKINLSVNFLDSFGMLRTLANLPITQSSIRYYFYNLIKKIRDVDLDELKEILKEEIAKQVDLYKQAIPSYLPRDEKNIRFFLSRLYADHNRELPFEDIYFRRKKDSFIIYDIITTQDVDKSTLSIPISLKRIFSENLCSACLIPRSLKTELDEMPVDQRIKKLKEKGYLPLFSEKVIQDDMKDFFISRNNVIKDYILKRWSL